jgi:hypothetical protein
MIYIFDNFTYDFLTIDILLLLNTQYRLIF